jgi:FkbM family methyltransferase
MDFCKQLEELLSESAGAAQLRQQTSFDQVAGDKRRFVVFGAGRLGRAVAQGLRSNNLEPVAFADNNSQLWGGLVDDVPILSPGDAARAYGEKAVFVVAIWHPSNTRLMSALLEQLRGLRCVALSFPVLFWRYPDSFLPYFFWEQPAKLLSHRADVLAAFELLSDDLSRQTFVSQLQLRLRADFECIGAPSSEEQYFPDLFFLLPDELFVDCGTYTGDTIRTFVEKSGGVFSKIVGFEADPAAISRFEVQLDQIRDRVVLNRVAVGAKTGVARFDGDGIGGGHLSESGGAEVPCVRLDDLVAEDKVSLIKMDIEGAEPDALDGARTTIVRHRPVLAICAYHRPDHLWKVPAALKELLPDAELFLRAHRADGLDTVCYAIPPERRKYNYQNPSQTCKSHGTDPWPKPGLV